MAARVATARAMQAERYGTGTNATAPTSEIERVAEPTPDGIALLREAAEKMSLSARGYHRVLKVARTLADLDGAARVGRVHVAESVSYRMAGERLVAA